jgi:DNA topoisomerase VI subunit B
MGTNQKQQSQPQTQNFSGIDMNSLKQMIRDTVRDTVRDVVREELSKSGMLTESESKSNDSLQMRVGKHVFEGKITKIKKVQ